MDIRKIIFRGKRADNGEWVYGYFVEDGFYTIWSHNEDDFLAQHLVDPSTVGQFTGLTDYNGKEIYEGDIVKDEIGVVYEIHWYDDLASFMAEMIYSARPFMISDIGTKYMKVIGNVFDNPELIPNQPTAI